MTTTNPLTRARFAVILLFFLVVAMVIMLLDGDDIRSSHYLIKTMCIDVPNDTFPGQVLNVSLCDASCNRCEYPEVP